jgi:hypothetical protein
MYMIIIYLYFHVIAKTSVQAMFRRAFVQHARPRLLHIIGQFWHASLIALRTFFRYFLEIDVISRRLSFYNIPQFHYIFRESFLAYDFIYIHTYASANIIFQHGGPSSQLVAGKFFFMFFRPNLQNHVQCFKILLIFMYLCHYWGGGHSGNQDVNGRIILKRLSGVGCENVNWVE